MQDPKKLINQVVKLSEVKRSHEENFLLIVKVKQGKSEFTSNYATVNSQIESKISSQHDEASKIIDFSITKVEKDKDEKVVKTTLISNMTKGKI